MVCSGGVKCRNCEKSAHSPFWHNSLFRSSDLSMFRTFEISYRHCETMKKNNNRNPLSCVFKTKEGHSGGKHPPPPLTSDLLIVQKPVIPLPVCHKLHIYQPHIKKSHLIFPLNPVNRLTFKQSTKET